MKKTLIVTVAALAAVAGGLMLLRDRGASSRVDSGPDPRVGKPLLDDALVTRAAALRLEGGERSVVVRRGPDGDWTLPESFDLPADFDKLRRLVGDLREASVTRLVTSSTDRLARLELDKAKLVLLDDSGAEVGLVRFGKASTGGGSFVAFAAAGPAYEIASNPWIDTNPDGWSRKQVLDFPVADVLGVVFHAVDGSTLEVRRTESAEPWNVEGDEPVGGLRTNEVDRLLGQVLNARFSTATALDHPDAVGALAAAVPLVDLTLKDGAKIAVKVGRRLPEPTPEGQEAPAQPPGSGPVYLFYELGDRAGPWSAPLAKAGLQFYDYLWTSRPANRDAFGNPPPPPPPAAGSAPAEGEPAAPPSGDSPGTISVVTEPIEIPPFVPPAEPAAEPEPTGNP